MNSGVAAARISAPIPPPPPQPAASLLSRPTLIALFAGGLVGIIVVAVIAVIVKRPPIPTGCKQLPCIRVSLANAQRIGIPWDSNLGLSTDVDASIWNAVHVESRLLEVKLKPNTVAEITLRLEVAPDLQMSVTDMLQHELDVARQDIPALDADCVDIPGTQWAANCSAHPERQLLSPAVGYVSGIGGMWSGTSSDGSQLSVIVMVAQQDNVTAAVMTITDIPFGSPWDEKSHWGYTTSADDISNSIIWPGEH